MKEVEYPRGERVYKIREGKLPEALMDGEVHVWKIELGDLLSCSRDLDEFLDSSELKRKSRFSAKEHANRFALMRTHLKTILSKYIDAKAEDLQFELSKYGRPFLNTGNLNFSFSLSHSRSKALLAVSLDGVCGIDLEFKELLDESDAQLFRSFDKDATSKIENGEWRENFYQSWTLKEATAKALGLGMRLDFKKINADRSSVPHQVIVEERSVNPKNLWAIPLKVFEGYEACFVTDNKATSIKIL